MINDVNKILAYIQPGDRVLDIGGATETFPRANAVIDILPYEGRQHGPPLDMPEQFTKTDWYVGDICHPAIWENFGDKEFDFVVCSHTLEDIRDPIFTCSQLIRVGKAGYIECPSRFRECLKTKPEDPISGWEHHRWILDVEDGTLIFTPKLHWANLFDYIGDEHREYAFDYYHQFTGVLWYKSFDYVERVTRGSTVEIENQFYFYENYRYDSPSNFHVIENVEHRGKTFLWFSDYKLPIEQAMPLEGIVARHQMRMEALEREKNPSLFQLIKRRWAK